MKFGSNAYEYNAVDGKPVVVTYAFTVDPTEMKMTIEAITFAPYTNYREKTITEYNIVEAE